MPMEARMMEISEYLGRIADALEQLVINKKAKMINETLQQEDIQFTKETLEVEELVYIDNLEDVIVVKESDSGLAYNIMKDGYETWIAKSHIKDEKLPLPFGVSISEIILKDDHKWILKKDNKGVPKTEWKRVGSG